MRPLIATCPSWTRDSECRYGIPFMGIISIRDRSCDVAAYKTFSKMVFAASSVVWSERNALRTDLYASASFRKVAISCATQTSKSRCQSANCENLPFSPFFSASSSSAPPSSSSPNNCLCITSQIRHLQTSHPIERTEEDSFLPKQYSV